MPYVANILIYPVKSLDGVVIDSGIITKGGAIEHDREWAIFDDLGRFVNGKRDARVHLLRSAFDGELKRLYLKVHDQEATFDIEREHGVLESWLSDYFGFTVKVVQNKITGFPDDTNASGPTVISTATIEEVASWFSGVSVDEMRLRMRANIEIAGVPPFWEDQLFTEAGQHVNFQVGSVLFKGINPCQRCVVPTRDTQTGKATANFQKTFVTRRKETLPLWATPTRFNHFFRLSVNTNIPATEVGKVLHQGDVVKIIGVSAKF